jgi:polygalacturonase
VIEQPRNIQHVLNAHSPSGDATGATDTANINADITALAAAGGGTLQMASGMYQFNGPLAELRRPSEIVGSPSGKTTFKMVTP